MKFPDCSDICQLICNTGMNGRSVCVVLVWAYWLRSQLMGFLLLFRMLWLVSVLLGAYTSTVTWHFSFDYMFLGVSLSWPVALDSLSFSISLIFMMHLKQLHLEEKKKLPDVFLRLKYSATYYKKSLLTHGMMYAWWLWAEINYLSQWK